MQPIGSYVQATVQVLQTWEASLPPLLVVSDGSAALRQFSQHMREVADVEILADDLPQAPNLPTGRSGKLAIDFPVSSAGSSLPTSEGPGRRRG